MAKKMAQHEIETTCNLRRWWFYTVLTVLTN